MKYTRAYKEIVKFLCVLGTILSFASRDIESKVNRMDELLSSEEGKNYLFLDDMLKYELKAGITNADGIEQVKSQKGKRYGTRIMFRLHQAMAFLVQFFINVREQPHSKIHSIVNDAYKATISRNHSWLVRKTATIAFYAIPSRNTLIGRMGHDTSEQKLMDELKEIIDITTDVYALIAKVFDKYSLVALNEPKTPTGNLKKSSSESAMTSKSKQV
ncbi:ceramide-1-phosphate transfer protein-like [Watersipora subatra]|uniref:ceramide-1-phosphate transfer protein-like n=1 Tax=Watersipora subatra TaxID=2589382 RepID=UPI00355BB1EF